MNACLLVAYLLSCLPANSRSSHKKTQRRGERLCVFLKLLVCKHLGYQAYQAQCKSYNLLIIQHLSVKGQYGHDCEQALLSNSRDLY
jgi:hypothetical protein